MTLTSDDMDVLRQAADEAGVDLRESYSGRGMAGQYCIGVTVHGYEEAGEFRAALRAIDASLEEALGESSSDAMGRSVIVYWPGARVPS